MFLIIFTHEILLIDIENIQKKLTELQITEF